MHNIYDELKYQIDWITDCGVRCHLASDTPLRFKWFSGERSLPIGLLVLNYYQDMLKPLNGPHMEIRF